MAEPRPVVRHQSKMDAETFLKHMNARHAPLGGLTVIGKSNVPGDENEDLLRVYHDKAHELGLDSIGNGRTKNIDHDHGEPEEK